MKFPEETFFTGVRDRRAEAILRWSLPRMAEDIRQCGVPEDCSIFLGGGYGRGEGGVYRCPDGGVRLYNDLDFFVITDHLSAKERRRIRKALSGVGGKWSARLGIEVDFGIVRDIGEWRAAERSLMIQELKRGHFCVYGREELLDGIREFPPEELPVMEAVRLLVNRGMGLLFAGAAIYSARYDSGFFLRNVNKAILGAADALLIHAGRYRWDAAGRAEAFREIAPRYAAMYEAALRWKYQPVHVDTAAEVNRPHWDRARKFWLFAVRCVSGAAGDFHWRKIDQALHELCRKEGEVGWRHALRWMLRGRALRPLSRLRDSPLSKLLTGLYRVLCRGTVPVPGTVRRNGLYRKWLVFN